MNKSLTRRFFLGSFGAASLWTGSFPCKLLAQPVTRLPLVHIVDLQPLIAQVKRILEATEYLGTPLSAESKEALRSAFKLADVVAAGERIQQVLDAYCLLGVQINAEMRVKVTLGEAKPQLVEAGWRQFLVKVHNESGTTAELHSASPHAQSVFSYRAPPLSPEEARGYAKLLKVDAKQVQKIVKGRPRPYGNSSDAAYKDDSEAENVLPLSVGSICNCSMRSR